MGNHFTMLNVRGDDSDRLDAIAEQVKTATGAKPAKVSVFAAAMGALERELADAPSVAAVWAAITGEARQ